MFLHGHGRLATSDVACCCTASGVARLQKGLVLTCCSRIDADRGCDVSDAAASDDVVLPRALRSDSERKILARDSFFTAETNKLVMQDLQIAKLIVMSTIYMYMYRTLKLKFSFLLLAVTAKYGYFPGRKPTSYE